MRPGGATAPGVSMQLAPDVARLVDDVKGQQWLHHRFSGECKRLQSHDEEKCWELEVDAAEALVEASLGCSIAVNGVCLTATEFDDATCTFGLAPETLRCTNLASLSSGERVNLERAAAISSRLTM